MNHVASAVEGAVWAHAYRFLCGVAILALAALLGACGGGGGGAPAASPPPDISIQVQPADATAIDGTTVAYSVTVAGDVTLQWQRLSGNAWVDVPGATSTQLSVGAVALADSGTQYRVVVTSRTNSGVRLISSAANLTVVPLVVAPSILVAPAGLIATAGQSVNFVVTAGGTSLTYQWQRSVDGISWTNVSSATTATLSVSGVAQADSGQRFRAVVTNSMGSVTSATALLTVNPAPAAPIFAIDPSAIVVVSGQQGSFNATAIGTPAPTLAWQVSADGLAWSTLGGETGGSLNVGPVTLTHDGTQYRAVATNSSGSVASAAARLSVVPAPAAPTIQAAPQNLTVGTGAMAVFSVAASGSPSVSYQWQVSTDAGTSFANIVGATEQMFFLTGATRADNGKRFRVVVTNSEGTATSSAATLTVLNSPAITVHPVEQAWRPGQTEALFTVTALGDNLSYQWQISADGTTFTSVSGATGTTYLHGTSSPTTTNWVRVVVSNAVGTTTSNPAYLQALHWGFVNPRPVGEALTGLTWLNTTTVLAVGGSQGIFRSTDAGVTWTIASESWSSAALRNIAFDGTNGVAVGDFGNVKRSVDGGAHWVTATSTIGENLNDVAFNGQGVVIAVGSSGAIVRSMDGGISWTHASHDGGAVILRGIEFSGAGIGLAVGNNGTILRSINGGANWSVVRNVGPALATVAFADDNTAIAAGQDGTMLRSADAGLTWSAVSSGTPYWLSSVHFVNASVGAATSSQGLILRTADGGATWSTVSPIGPFSYGGVRFGPGGTGVVVGDGGGILRSTDGGVTWARVTQGPTTWFNGVAFASLTTGVAVGSGGGVARTVDEGASWTAVPNANPNQLNGVAFASPSIGVAVGLDGTIVRTSDAGATWTTVPSGTSLWLSAVAFADANIGVIATGNGLLRTTDAGSSWQPATGGNGFLRSVAFGDSQVGIAVGDSGSIVRTVDGGQTWSPVTSATSESLNSVSFASSTTVVAVGLNGAVLRSTDAGASWSASQISNHAYTGVRFISPTVGVAVASTGLILHTSNAGATWSFATRPQSSGLAAVAPAGSNKVIAVGNRGAILRNTNF